MFSLNSVINFSLTYKFLSLSLRISTSAFPAKRKLGTCTRWNDSISISTTAHRHPKLVATNPTRWKPANSQFNDAYNHWCTRVSVATPIVDYHHVRRWNALWRIRRTASETLTVAVPSASSSSLLVVTMRNIARKTNVLCRSVPTSSRSCGRRTWLNGKFHLKISQKPASKLVKFSYRLQKAQFNRRRAAAMNIRMAAMSNPTPAITAQATPGGFKEEMSPGAVSPAQGMGGMGSPHHAGIGMKPGTQKPPPAVLQVVKQVRIEGIFGRIRKIPSQMLY